MAPIVGRPAGSKNKTKGEGNTLEKYVIGGEVLKGTMNRVVKEIEKMRKEMGKMYDQMKESIVDQIEKMRKEMIEERTAREEERRKEAEKWEEEKRILGKRIADLEWINEERKRERRKNNIIIKEVRWKGDKKNKLMPTETEVKEWIKINLRTEMEIEIRRTSKIWINENIDIVLVENRKVGTEKRNNE